MDRYCCSRKCFLEPNCHVDGVACTKCESFCYCKCECVTFQAEYQGPTKEPLVLYKTRRFYTCCPDVCVRFLPCEISQSKCCVCYDKILCECKLKSCKNRSSWKEGQ